MQVDQFESEVESLSVQTRKKKGDKEVSLSSSLVRSLLFSLFPADTDQRGQVVCPTFIFSLCPDLENPADHFFFHVPFKVLSRAFIYRKTSLTLTKGHFIEHEHKQVLRTVFIPHTYSVRNSFILSQKIFAAIISGIKIAFCVLGLYLKHLFINEAQRD